MSTLSFGKALFDQKKRKRLQKQQERLKYVLSLDEQDQAEALLAVWPQALPRAVKQQLDRFLLEEWVLLKETHQKMAFYKNHPLAMPEFLKYDLPLLGDVGRKYHQETIENMLALLRDLKGSKRITCRFTVVDPMEGVFNTVAPFLYLSRTFQITEAGEVLDDQGKPDEKWFGYVVGFSLTGMATMVIRQELPLKIQRLNSEGQLAWENQERVFGLHFGVNEIFGVSAQEMQENFNIEHGTGEAFSTPHGTSFGDSRPLVQRYLPQSAPARKVSLS